MFVKNIPRAGRYFEIIFIHEIEVVIVVADKSIYVIVQVQIL